MKKYPSIEQFRNLIRTVRTNHDYQGRDLDGNPIYKHIENYPTLEFRGTVKLHGTNASIVKYSDGRIEFQSRERILSIENDNAGFMSSMSSKNFDGLFNRFVFNDYIAIYGEWCGGNIQKSIAISGLDKMFVIFGVMVDDVWVDLPKNLSSSKDNIYNILDFKTFKIVIDFNNPELVQNEIIEMTISVENSCPVGEHFNRNGIGEGIVFTCLTDNNLKFKSKGEKHSVSKVKKLNAIDVELMNSINDFVDFSVTENRLEQGISFFKENNIQVEPKNTGEFLKWIVNDVLKEEADTLVESGLDDKKVKSAIVNKAKVWFLNNITY